MNQHVCVVNRRVGAREGEVQVNHRRFGPDFLRTLGVLEISTTLLLPLPLLFTLGWISLGNIIAFLLFCVDFFVPLDWIDLDRKYSFRPLFFSFFSSVSQRNQPTLIDQSECFLILFVPQQFPSCLWCFFFLFLLRFTELIVFNILTWTNGNY